MMSVFHNLYGDLMDFNQNKGPNHSNTLNKCYDKKSDKFNISAKSKLHVMEFNNLYYMIELG